MLIEKCEFLYYNLNYLINPRHICDIFAQNAPDIIRIVRLRIVHNPSDISAMPGKQIHEKGMVL